MNRYSCWAFAAMAAVFCFGVCQPAAGQTGTGGGGGYIIRPGGGNLQLEASVTAPNYDYEYSEASSLFNRLSGSVTASSSGSATVTADGDKPMPLSAVKNSYDNEILSIPSGGSGYTSAVDHGGRNVDRYGLNPDWATFPTQELLEGISFHAEWSQSGDAIGGEGGFVEIYWLSAEYPEEAWLMDVHINGGEVTINRPGVENDEYYWVDADNGSITESCTLRAANISVWDDGVININGEFFSGASIIVTDPNSPPQSGNASFGWDIDFQTAIYRALPDYAVNDPVPEDGEEEEEEDPDL